MINGLDVFYTSKTGEGLKVIGSGLKIVETRGSGCKKPNKKIKQAIIGKGLKILN